jgi:glycosyltransferase involved in cell wall biosynthesis
MKMKILMINYSEIKSPGGVHKTIRELAKNLSENGHNVTVVQGNLMNLKNQEIINQYKIIRVQSKYAKYFYGLSPEITGYVCKNLTNISPDIIHVHGYHTLLSAEIIFTIKKKIKSNIPIIFSPHYCSDSHSTIAGKYLWNFYNNVVGTKAFDLVDHIVCASEYERKELMRDIKLPSSKISIIPHGVNRLNFNKCRDLKSNYINLLYVGNLLYLKGVQHILNVVNVIKFMFNKDVILNIVGHGEYQQELLKLAERLNILDSIKWYHSLFGEQLYQKYREADIFLLLSSSENYGIVIAEALASGTPCIVSNTTALKEFIKEPGCFGVNFPPDPKKIAQLILKIYDSQIKVGPFSNKISTWDEVTKDYEILYKKSLRRRKI